MKQNIGHKLDKSRRRFLISAAIGSLALVGSVPLFKLTRRYWRHRGSVGHVTGPPDVSEFPAQTLTTVAFFTGALFGQKLSPDDTTELVDRLRDAVRWDSGWRTEYRWLTEFVDQRSAQLFETSFVQASPDQRETIIQRIMARPPSARSRKSRLLAMVSETELKRRRIHFSTIQHLKWLYRYSGVPWRFRGYTAWPGIPHDQLDYTRKGPTPEC